MSVRWKFVTTVFIASLIASVAPAQEDARAPWSLIVVSDVHTYLNATLERNFIDLVPCLADLKPRLVVVAGDSTNGNPKDHYTKERADSWWRAFKASLEPLTRAGIPVLPVAGNHDYYRKPHQLAYRDAWKDLATSVAPLQLNGEVPLYYSTDIEGVHLAFAHVVTQELEPKMKAWLEKDLSAASDARSKIVFAHVPFSTVLGERPVKGFKREFGGLLARHGVDAYVCGHEHLAWDEVFEVDGKPVHQVIVGSTSGSYNFPLSLRAYGDYCSGDRCVMPGNGKTIKLESAASRQQENIRVFAVITFVDGKPSIELKAFKPRRPKVGDRLAPKDFTSICNGEIVPFEAQD